jgi:hypothetical protein
MAHRIEAHSGPRNSNAPAGHGGEANGPNGTNDQSNYSTGVEPGKPSTQVAANDGGSLPPADAGPAVDADPDVSLTFGIVDTYCRTWPHDPGTRSPARVFQCKLSVALTQDVQVPAGGIYDGRSTCSPTCHRRRTV